MDQNNSNSGPWYNPENLNSQNQTDGTSGNGEQTNSKQKDDFLSENNDNALAFGAISMILGIFSLISEKLILGILGLVFGKISENKKRNTYAKVGIVCSIISIAIGVISLIAVLVIFAFYGTAILEIIKDAVQMDASWA